MNTALWWVIQNTITVAVMIPLVIVACRLFRNRPAVQHVLWVVVLIKFLTPPLITWPIPVVSFDEEVAASVPVEPSTVPETSLGKRQPEERPAVSLLTPGELAGVKPVPQVNESHRDAVNADVAASAETQIDWGAAMLWLLLCIWIAGSVFCLARQIRRIVQHTLLVRHSSSAPESLMAEVYTTALRLGVRPPEAVVVRGILSPFVWCLGRLRLIWPESMTSRADVVRSRGVLAHELAHVRRGDHWVAWLEMVAALVWWWNPLFWFVRTRLRETAEMACDALAIDTCPESRCAYAELLLELSAGYKSGAPAPVLAVSAGTPSSFERRLSMILSERVSGKMSWHGFLAAIGLALLILPGWSLGEQPKPSSPATVEPVEPGLAKGGKDAAVERVPEQCIAFLDKTQKLNLRDCMACHTPSVHGSKGKDEKDTPEERVKKLEGEIKRLRAALDELQKELKPPTPPTPPVKVTPPHPKWEMKRFPLKYTAATEVSKVLQDVFKGSAGVKVTDATTNTIIVYGTPKDLEAVEAIIKSLDAEKPPPKQPTTIEMKPNSFTLDPLGSKQPEGGALNLLDLGDRYLKATADLKLARSRLARLEKQGKAITEQQLEEAKIELERAEKQAKLVTTFIKDTLTSNRDALSAARDELNRAQELVKKGLMPVSHLDGVKRRVGDLETRLKQLESILTVAP